MKLEVSETEAYLYSFVLASFFVIAVYIWKPIYNPPYDLKKIRKDKLTQTQQKQIEQFETKMRTQSVGTLCFFALLTIIMLADHAQRPQVSILNWFAFSLSSRVLKYTVYAVVLNTVLFMGEVFQYLKGMEQVHYKLDFTALKNLLLAPLFEEFIYRVCIINLFLESKALEPSTAAVVCPLFFSVSHAHHVFSERRSPGFSYRSAIARTLF